MEDQNNEALITINLKTINELPAVQDEFVLWSQLRTNKRIEVTDWVRERFILVPGLTQNIEFGESQIVNFIHVETQGAILANLTDETPIGYGEGGYGEGGYGGVGSDLIGFTINRILCVEGSYASLQLTNLKTVNIQVDLFAAVYAESI